MVSLETYAKIPLAQTFEFQTQASVGGAKVRARSIHERKNSILRADEHFAYSKHGDLAPICVDVKRRVARRV